MLSEPKKYYPMIIKTAWKNVWRNKIRSLVVIASVTIGIFGGVFAVAMMNGAIEQRMDAALNNEISHIQINQEGFRDNFDIQMTLDNVGSLDRDIKETEGVVGFANRIMITAMANTASKSAGVSVVGVNPEQEKTILDLDQKLIPGTGSYFESTSGNNLIYIGEDLAKELNIIRYRIEASTLDSLRARGVPETVLEKLEPFSGERFSSQKEFTREMKGVLTKQESSDYGNIILEEGWSFNRRAKMTLIFVDRNNIQTGAMFRIAGIYDIRNNMFEKSQVFVLNDDLQRLTGLRENEYHMVMIRVDELDNAKSIADKLSEEHPELEVMSWKELQPDMAMMNDLVTQFYVVFMLIILAALAFGIVNTMLMVVLERTKELGMLTAIGMNKKRVFSMIMTESVFLSLVGGFAGMIVSKIVIALTARNGINFSGYSEGFEAMGFSAHIYPEINTFFFVIVTILIVITGILSSVYPALKALKLDPADALRTE